MLNASGIGTYITNLLPRIVHAKPHYRFCLLGHPDAMSRLRWPTGSANVRLISCTAPIYSIREQFEFIKHTPSDTSLFWAPHYNIPLFPRRKLMVTVHDVFHLAMPTFVSGLHRRLYARAMFEMVRRRADLILTDSHFTADEFRRHVGDSRAALRPIHLGVADSWFQVTADKRPHATPYLLYVGNIKPHKNLVTLLRAFESIKQTISHDLVIVGKREGFITSDQSVTELATRMTGRVHFTGEIEKSLLEQYIAFADALVLPSLYEGFGLPPLEAMACGCPVIVSQTASLPEVCGDAALYCDPHSAPDIAQRIVQLLGNQRLQDTLRQHGRVRAATFSWSRCADQTLEAIETLLAS